MQPQSAADPAVAENPDGRHSMSLNDGSLTRLIAKMYRPRVAASEGRLDTYVQRPGTALAGA